MFLNFKRLYPETYNAQVNYTHHCICKRLQCNTFSCPQPLQKTTRLRQLVFMPREAAAVAWNISRVAAAKRERASYTPPARAKELFRPTRRLPVPRNPNPPHETPSRRPVRVGAHMLIFKSISLFVTN